MPGLDTVRGINQFLRAWLIRLKEDFLYHLDIGIKMDCQRNYSKFCEGEAVGIIDNVTNRIAVCNGCKEHTEPFIKRFED